MDEASFVPEMFKNAVKFRASDIHVEPGKTALRIRFRVDGQLNCYRSLPGDRAAPLLSQLKLMANLDIGERRLPQDGHLSYGDLQVRVSTIPTVYGEKIVLRLLRSHLLFSEIDELGMTERQLMQVKRWIKSPHGLLVVTGPTGAGKTTTLYTLLNQLNVETRNIVTLEDPVEIRLNGINQVQILERTGLTFARGLRSILRQDPDVIMIGEIRDQETVEIAVRAALTGHLVMTSLHTGDAVSAVTRLLDMGIPPYLVASSVSGVIAQRLVRKTCRACKGSGGHCKMCQDSGYSGRMAAFEVLTVDEPLQEFITRCPSTSQLRQFVRAKGMMTLKEHLLSLVEEGKTSLEELERVVTVDVSA